VAGDIGDRGGHVKRGVARIEGVSDTSRFKPDAAATVLRERVNRRRASSHSCWNAARVCPTVMGEAKTYVRPRARGEGTGSRT
jgi:hypothetical protein